MRLDDLLDVLHHDLLDLLGLHHVLAHGPPV
jgi:hypothetical protein